MNVQNLIAKGVYRIPNDKKDDIANDVAKIFTGIDTLGENDVDKLRDEVTAFEFEDR